MVGSIQVPISKVTEITDLSKEKLVNIFLLKFELTCSPRYLFQHLLKYIETISFYLTIMGYLSSFDSAHNLCRQKSSPHPILSRSTGVTLHWLHPPLRKFLWHKMNSRQKYSKWVIKKEGALTYTWQEFVISFKFLKTMWQTKGYSNPDILKNSY